MSNDVMIDIETLGTDQRAVVLSIGAIAFDAENPDANMFEGHPVAGDMPGQLPIFYTALNFDEQLAKGRTIKADTLRWWMRQNADAQIAAFDTVEATPHQDGWMGETMALRSLARFIEFQMGSTGKIWAKSPSFDLTILESLYRDFDDTPPWRYAQERDVRTIIDVAVIPNPVGKHEPIEDCLGQIKAVQDAYAKLRGEEIRIVLQSSNGPDGGEFVEVEDGDGRSINAGTWHEREDGFQELRIPGVRRG